MAEIHPTSPAPAEGGKIRQVLSHLSESLTDTKGVAPVSHGIGKIIERGLKATSQEKKTARTEAKASGEAVKNFKIGQAASADYQTAWNNLSPEDRDRVLALCRSGKGNFLEGEQNFLKQQKTQAESAEAASAGEIPPQIQKDALLLQVNDLLRQVERVVSQKQLIGQEYYAQEALVNAAQTTVNEQKAIIADLEEAKSAPIDEKKAAEVLITHETGLPRTEHNVLERISEMTAAIATGYVPLEQLLGLADAGTQDMIMRVWIAEKSPDQAPELAKDSREIVAEGVNKMFEAAKEAILGGRNEVELRASVESGLVDPKTVTAIGTALTGEVSFGEALSRYYLAEKAARLAASGLGEGHQRALQAESEKQRLELVEAIASTTEKKGQVLTAGGLEILQQFLGGQSFGYVSENGKIRILTADELDVLSKSAKKTLTAVEKDELGRSRYVEHKLVSVTDVFGPTVGNVEEASALFAKVVETMLSGSGEAQRDLVASVSVESVEKVLSAIGEAKKAVAQNTSEYTQFDGQEAILAGVLSQYRRTHGAVMIESQVNGINYIQERIKNEDPASVFILTDLYNFIGCSDSAPLRRLGTLIRNRARMPDYDLVLTPLKDAYDAGKMLSRMEMSTDMNSRDLIAGLKDAEHQIRSARDGVSGLHQKLKTELMEASEGDRATLLEITHQHKDARDLLTNLRSEVSTLFSRQTEIENRVDEIIASERDIDARVQLTGGELSPNIVADRFDNPISVVRSTIDQLTDGQKPVLEKLRLLVEKQRQGTAIPEEQEMLFKLQKQAVGYKNQIETEQKTLKRLEEAKVQHEKEREKAMESLKKQREELMKEKTNLTNEEGVNLIRLGELTQIRDENGSEVERAEKAENVALAARIAAAKAYGGEWAPQTGNLRWATQEDIRQLAKKRAIVEAMLYGVQLTTGIAGAEGREKPSGTVELDDYEPGVAKHAKELEKAGFDDRLAGEKINLGLREQQLAQTQQRLKEIRDQASQIAQVDKQGEYNRLRQEWEAAGFSADEFDNYYLADRSDRLEIAAPPQPLPIDLTEEPPPS